MQRDEFGEPARKLLERQVGSRCSNPGCRQPTRASSWDYKATINIGTAAHITAASKKGPRYDPNIDTVQRTSHENGIWLCRNCGTLVDSDHGAFPVELLRQWKMQAIERARSQVVAPAASRHLTDLVSPIETEKRIDADKERYKVFIQSLPSASGVIYWAKKWPASACYRESDSVALQTALEKWTAPENAFNDPTIQSALVTFSQALSRVLELLVKHTWAEPPKFDTYRVPADWKYAIETEARYYSAIEAIEKALAELVLRHEEFIQTAKSVLIV